MNFARSAYARTRTALVSGANFASQYPQASHSRSHSHSHARDGPSVQRWMRWHLASRLLWYT